jgi:hypothetical protein
MVESHIRTRLGMEQNFLPEKLVNDTTRSAATTRSSA